jgi:transcription elongation factor GreA
LSSEEKATKGQELNNFVRWFGRDRVIAELTAPEVAKYAEQINTSSTDPPKKLEPVRDFLQYAKKEKLLSTNLAVHLRWRRGSPKAESPSKQSPRQVQSLTPEGYDKLSAELAVLKEERPRIAEGLRQAAADKDFRENAPLDAVREEQGKLEARIKELEAILKSATIVEGKPRETLKVMAGHRVMVRGLDSDAELDYTLVYPREMNLAQGKISIASPLGKALLGREQGEIVEVTAPVGVLHYQIERIE